MCRICGVTPDDPEVHAAWHASLPVTPATREHERAQQQWVTHAVLAHEHGWEYPCTEACPAFPFRADGMRRGMRGDG